jgi:hypothetical protein
VVHAAGGSATAEKQLTVPESKVYIIHLRRPNRRDPNERRSDPYWEFGSFGCTGCHSNNLFHPRHAKELDGARLAFAQGGPLGFRLVLLTPPVEIKNWGDRLEARWTPAEMPFRYKHAPLLAANDRRSDFPTLERFALGTARASIEGGFSSHFRSRAVPLDERIARELMRRYERLRTAAPADAIAMLYEQALPYPPPEVDRNRRQTYRAKVSQLKGDEDMSCSQARRVGGRAASGRRQRRC